jgi:hypothetical protein
MVGFASLNRYLLDAVVLFGLWRIGQMSKELDDLKAKVLGLAAAVDKALAKVGSGVAPEEITAVAADIQGLTDRINEAVPDEQPAA